MYLTICHSDICYYVHKLSQYIANPQSAHMEVATIFLWYLKHTTSQGVLIQSCIFCIFFGNLWISWKAKRQKIVKKSYIEAEYRALASVSTWIIWLRNLLTNFHIHNSFAVAYCDNKATIQIANNPHTTKEQSPLRLIFISS